MNVSFLALALQADAPIDSSTWIILAVVLLILFFIVVIVAIGLTIFFIMRKRSKASIATPGPEMSTGSSSGSYGSVSPPESAPVAPDLEPFRPMVESAPGSFESTPRPAPSTDLPEFDPSRTVAISRENTVEINYGTIKFVSGALAGQQFPVEPEGSYIGRESSLAQIVVSDPRISKRHLWIGVRDGVVKIADQDSRNGTFINDPKSERITEATLNPGDVVIMGESDVARFEYQT